MLVASFRFNENGVLIGEQILYSSSLELAGDWSAIVAENMEFEWPAKIGRAELAVVASLFVNGAESKVIASYYLQ